MTPEELQQVRYRARSLSGWRERLKLPLRWLEDIDVALEATNAIDALDGARRDAEANVKELDAKAAGLRTLVDSTQHQLEELRGTYAREQEMIATDLAARREEARQAVEQMDAERQRVERELVATRRAHAAFLSKIGAN